MEEIRANLKEAVARGRDPHLSAEQCAALVRLLDKPPQRLWLWKNFVGGRPEYWAFDNAYPIHLTDGDPQTLGEPCGYAIFKPSRNGRPDVPDETVLKRIAGVQACEPCRLCAHPGACKASGFCSIERYELPALGVSVKCHPTFPPKTPVDPGESS